MSPKRVRLSPPSFERGVTIIEIIMVIVILGIISGTVAFIMLQGTRSFGAIAVREDLKGGGTLAMERISKEVRLLRCTTVGNACNPTAADITNMTADELRFVNINYEGAGFRRDAGTNTLKLRRGSAGGDPEDTLSGDVSSMTFEYLKKDGTAAAAAADVWLINVTMTLSSGGESLTFKASVHPRSFR